MPAGNAELGVNNMLCPLLPTVVVPDTSTPLCDTSRAPVTVLLFMGALVNSVITAVVGTPVAPLPGRMLITYGVAVETGGVVVNSLVVLASAFPERSVIRLVAVTVSVAPAGNDPPL